MARGHRLSALDASFLALERRGARLHVASITVFERPTPPYDELLAHIEGRLHLAPRFRQRLAEVPLGQGRPVWVDDPHFNLRYHLRHAGLPSPGGEEQLKVLAGRVFAQRLDPTKPLWEMLLVDGLWAGAGRAGDRAGASDSASGAGGFALIAKSHHALVDGISAADITTVLFDAEPDAPPPAAARRRWTARPLPTPAQLLSDALVERATRPAELVRAAGAVAQAPREVLRGALEHVAARGGLPFGAGSPAPPTPLNVRPGPHRRYTWVDAQLGELQAVKDALGGTVNDAVLAVVAGALGRFLRHRGVDTRERVLKALVPVSVRAEVAQGALGNEVAPMWAPLPIGVEDPVEQFAAIRDAVAAQERSRRAVGARTLTELAGFASPTVMSQAARLQQRQRSFNVVVTNVPGPQAPLYLLGRRLRALYPVLPLAARQTLAIAVTSYDGRLGFGLLADYDEVPDLDVLAGFLRTSIDALSAGASVPRRAVRGRRRAAARRTPASRI